MDKRLEQLIEMECADALLDFYSTTIIFNHKQYICTIVLTVYRQFIFLLIKILNRILHDLR